MTIDGIIIISGAIALAGIAWVVFICITTQALLWATKELLKARMEFKIRKARMEFKRHEAKNNR